MVKEIATHKDFEQEVLLSEEPVVVDFWAEWCSPCRRLAPIMKELATEYEGKVKIVKVDTTEDATLAQQYGVMSVPTLLFFKGGQEMDRLIGLHSKEELEEEINRLL